MSLLQAITEIESILTGLSFIKHPDERDPSLVDSSSAQDKHFKVLAAGDPFPYLDAGSSPNWQIGIKVELATLIADSISDARITASERGRQVIEALEFTSLTYTFLWESRTETIEDDNNLIWMYQAKLRYQE